MRAAILSVGALALGASAWSYPECEHDNCYREMVDKRFYDDSVAFCPGYLAGSTYGIPSTYENCESPEKVSSACSCITYSATPTYAPTSTEEPYPTTTPEYPTTTPEYPTSTYEPYPTETPEYPSYTPTCITTTTCYTNTYGTYTTETYSYTTLVPCETPTTLSTSCPPTTYATYAPTKPAPTYPVVTAGAGRVGQALEIAAAAAGVAVAFL